MQSRQHFCGDLVPEPWTRTALDYSVPGDLCVHEDRTEADAHGAACKPCGGEPCHKPCSGDDPLYPDDLSLKEKIQTICREIYGADGVVYDAAAEKAIAKLEDMGMGNLPICMAKNQYSLSDDPKKLGRPEGFDINIREVYVSAGAGFVVAITGTIMTMPGLPKVPAAENISVNDDGVICGLF